MAEEAYKQWTLLIYANGNNELEPEMWQAKLDAEKTGSSHTVNVVMQIGREDRRLVRIFRPAETIPDASEKWTGVRRYYIRKNHSDLIDDLGRGINMAHPRSLYDFIKWGMEDYPARHYMLILGGHALQFVGMMTDYSQNAPYIMGLPEMAKALSLCKRDTGRNIDILILDSCFMNYIEVIYELGQEEDHAVQNVVTFIEGGPLAGLPYDKIIYFIEENVDKDAVVITKKIVDGLYFDLVAFEIKHKKLQNIKKAANKLAFNHLNYDSKEDIKTVDENSLNIEIESIITHYKRISDKKCFAVRMAGRMNSPIVNYYYKLAFSINNYWTDLVTTQFNNVDFASIMPIELEPISLPMEVLYFYIAIMNKTLNRQKLEKILNKLLTYKNWRFDLKTSMVSQ